MIRVLLIDDQRLVASAVRRLLADDPSIVFQHCADPNGALAAVAEFQPTVVLVDLVMPGVSGIEVVRELRAQPASTDLPLCMLSADEDAEHKAQAFAAGANDYLIKLPQGPELLARVRYHSRAWLAGRERDAAFRAVAEHRAQLALDNSFIRDTFGRYLSDDVVARLLETPGGLRLGGDRRRVTVLMADLRGFTSMSERLPPEQVVAILNHHLEIMTDVILAYGGTIEELLGDGILVVFGAPVEQDDHAERAVTCAVVMQLAMQRVHERCRADGLPAVTMGIGVHTGEVVAGNIGSKKRAKYGVIGATVNLTARIEGYTVGGQILISEATRAAASSELAIVGHFQAEPKGVAAPITIHDVVGIGGQHGLEIPRFDADLRAPAAPIEVRTSVLVGKTHSQAVRPGRLVRVGPRDAELEVAGGGPDGAPAALSDLWLELAAPGAPGARFYAKVLSRPAHGGVLLRFTALPDEVAAWLAAAAGTDTDTDTDTDRRAAPPTA